MSVFVLFVEEGEGSEAGETMESAAPEVDIDKVIEYPGFTIEMPPDCMDVSVKNNF